MEQARHDSFRTRNVQLLLATCLVVALLSTGRALPAGAQTNTSLGTGALSNNTTGSNDTALGFNALNSNTLGVVNTATGDSALASNISGCHNTANGVQSLVNNTTGNYNIAMGYNAGSSLTTGDNNIEIGNVGVAAEANTIRIGTKGTQTRTFIAGISNTRLSLGLPVYVNANGRLGVVASSVRFKRDIHDMGDASSKVMRLRPVMFRYKEDQTGTLQYGLIGEEVERVYPELVTRDDEGGVEGVRYDLLPALLLNEVQRLVRENDRKEARISALQRQLAAQQQQVNSLQKRMDRIDALTARLNALEESAYEKGRERLAAAMR